MIATLAVRGGTPGGGVGCWHSLPVFQNRLEFATASRVSLLNNPRPTGAVPWVSPYPRNALFGEADPTAERLNPNTWEPRASGSDGSGSCAFLPRAATQTY